MQKFVMMFFKGESSGRGERDDENIYILENTINFIIVWDNIHDCFDFIRQVS
jgi:hypothetical protein